MPSGDIFKLLMRSLLYWYHQTQITLAWAFDSLFTALELYFATERCTKLSIAQFVLHKNLGSHDLKFG